MAETRDNPERKGDRRGLLLKGLGLTAAVGAIGATVRFAFFGGSSPEEEFRKALELHREGLYQEAAEAFRRVAEARPGDALPRIMQGSAHANMGSYRKAVDSFTQALSISPDDPVVYLYRGEALLGLGLEAQAKRDFQKARALAGGDERVATAANTHLSSLANQSSPVGIER